MHHVGEDMIFLLEHLIIQNYIELAFFNQPNYESAQEVGQSITK